MEIPNTFSYFNKVLLNTLKDLKVNPIPSKDVREKFWFSGDQYIKLLNSWGIEDENTFWEKFDSTDFERRKKLLLEQKISLYTDVIPVLERIRQYNKKIGIISNTAEYVVKHLINEFEIEQYFQFIFGMGKKSQKKAKPSPFGILKALDFFKCKEVQNYVLMIGDSSADIEAAKRANIKSCLIIRDSNKFQNGYSDWDFKPDYIINDLREIMDIPTE